MELIGFEGRFNDGAFWNAGIAAILHEGKRFNSGTGWEITNKQWDRCVEEVLVGLCPSPIDLGPRTLEETTGAHAPYVLAYHFDDDKMHTFVDKALEDCEPLRDMVFEARKHEGSRWLVFSNFGHYKRFGIFVAAAALEHLDGAPEEELSNWFNPVSVASGIDCYNPDIRELRKRVGRAFHAVLKRKYGE